MNIYQRINEVRKMIGYVQKDKAVSTGGGSYKAVTHDAVTGMVREALVIRLPGAHVLQGASLFNIHPDRAGVLLPRIHRERFMGMRNRVRIVAGLANHDEIVSDSLAAHG